MAPCNGFRHPYGRAPAPSISPTSLSTPRYVTWSLGRGRMMAPNWTWLSIRWMRTAAPDIHVIWLAIPELLLLQDLPEISLNDYVPSNEWDLLAHPGRKNVIYYPCCTTPFPDLTFSLVLKRQVILINEHVTPVIDAYVIYVYVYVYPHHKILLILYTHTYK